MNYFVWGGVAEMTIEKVWSTGDDIWRIGDAVEHPDLSGGIGIVVRVVGRKKIDEVATGKTVRTTYVFQ